MTYRQYMRLPNLHIDKVKWISIYSSTCFDSLIVRNIELRKSSTLCLLELTAERISYHHYKYSMRVNDHLNDTKRWIH